jgi:dolichol-phosphate mannosyltransferase
MLSFVIPIRNEQESLQELHRQIDEVASEHNYDVEFIFVDDGSDDESWRVITELAGEDARAYGIRFRRNFGKAEAISAGFDAAVGEIVFTMDGDLQDDPQEIPRLLEKLAAGFDVISGWKKNRYDPWHKVVTSRMFNWLVGVMTGVKLHDHNCGFKCCRREVFDEVRLYGEMHRFIPVLANARGFRVDEIVVHHRPRQFGVSKYGVGRIPKALLDLLTVSFLTGFSQRPQHLLGKLGCLCFFGGAIGMTVLTVGWFVSRAVTGLEPLHLHQRAIFYYSLTALLLGAQFMSVGFLAELILAHHNRDQRNYSIAERTVAQAGRVSHKSAEQEDKAETP